MTRPLVILCAALACGGGPVVYTSVDGRFSVMMPAHPREFGGPPEAGFGAFHTIAAEGAGALYAVIYADVSSTPPDAHAFLARRRDDALLSAPGTVVTDRRITLGDHPGLEVEVHFPDGTLGRTRHFLVGDRLYEVHVFGRPEDFFPDQFFQSFALR